MLTSKQYEAIGRLALGFNEIENVIDTYVPHLIGAPEWEVAELLADPGADFERKANRLVRIVGAIAEHFDLCTPRAILVRDYLKRAKELAGQRNGYVHALVIMNFRKNEAHIRVRKTVQPVDEAAIIELAQSALELAKRLDGECAELYLQLVELRK